MTNDLYRKDTLALRLEDFYEDDSNDAWLENSNQGKNLENCPTTRFQEKELIATGGMKNIYKVFDTKTDRYIALATLKDDVTEALSEDFLSEAYLTASLEHPNIISVYDVGVDQHFSPYFTMELKVGDSLTNILEQLNINDPDYTAYYSLERLLGIFTKVCDAVSYAHSREVVHLDIKPDNIQVGQFGEVQLCDWGLGAKLKDLNSEPSGFIKGTPGFMSPEQINSDKKISLKSDVYALGALLYTILTGQSPNEGGLNTIIKKTISGDINLPMERFPDKQIPVGMNAVVSKAMETRKSKRYKSVEDLKEEVICYLNGHSTSAQKAGFLQELYLFYKRNSVVCQIVLTFLLLISFLLSFSIVKIKKSESQAIEALSKQRIAFKELGITKEKVQEAYKESQNNFEMYKLEQEKKLKLQDELVSLSFNDSLRKLKAPVFYHDPIESLNKAIASLVKHYEVTKNSQIKVNIFKAYFISQRFSEALKYSGHEINPGLLRITKKFVTSQRDSRGTLIDKEFYQLIKELDKNTNELKRSYIEQMIVYHLAAKKEKYTTPEIIRAVLKLWNPSWDVNDFRYDKSKQTLKISGTGMAYLTTKNKEVSSKLSVLRFLKFNHLDISETSIRTLRELAGVSVDALDIRDTPITNLRLIRDMANVRTVIVEENQFPKDELNKVIDTLELTIR